MANVPNVILNSDGQTMPIIAMGTASSTPADDNTTKAAVLQAIRSGYRHFDTAYVYNTENAVGEAIIEALELGLIKSRDELFITSKLWCSHAARHLVVPAIQASLRNLKLDYMDLYLIHIPLRIDEAMAHDQLPLPEEAFLPIDVKLVWEGMEECKKLGLTNAIGVSNFSSNTLEKLLSTAIIPPAVNQVQVNPHWHQKELREFCKAKGIHVSAYSPLGGARTWWGNDEILESDKLRLIADHKAKSTAQVALRWVYEQGASLIVKSFDKERMKKNIEIFDWCLSDQESDIINQLPQRKAVTFSNIFGPYDIVLKLDADI